MIILDTNVVSEPLKQSPNLAVMRWLDAQDPETLYITAVNLAELLTGIEIMPGGRRRSALKQALKTQLEDLFKGRILAFDEGAAEAEAFAATHARSRAVGNGISFADCAIAAIATAHGYLLATRNAADFAGTGVQILNPWDE